MLDEFVMCIRGFEAGIVALHIHLPTTSTTDFPEIQEPDLEGQHTGCVDEIARHFTGEVPVQKVKTEAWGVHRRANEVLSQRQFCRANIWPPRRAHRGVPGAKSAKFTVSFKCLFIKRLGR